MTTGGTGPSPRSKAPVVNRRDEAERRYDSAARAVDRLRGIVRGDQDADRTDNLKQFFTAVYGVLEQLDTAANLAEKTGLAGSRVWYNSVRTNADIALFSKLRNTEQHWASTSVNHRVDLGLPATMTIVAPVRLADVVARKWPLRETLRRIAFDPTVYRLWSWLRKPKPPVVPQPGYAWHLDGTMHNQVALPAYRLDANEIARLHTTPAADLLAQILASVRTAIDDAKARGIL